MRKVKLIVKTFNFGQRQKGVVKITVGYIAYPEPITLDNRQNWGAIAFIQLLMTIMAWWFLRQP